MPTRRTFSVTLNTMHQHSLAEGKVDSAQFIRERLPEILRALPAVEEEAGFALPSRTLLGLEQIIRELALENIFEFGSGRSTKVFLDCGCNVSALEHDAAWAEQTLQSLPAEQRGRLVLRCDPLRKVFVAGAPMKGWILDEHSANALAAAQLVLIDSPPLPPFREHALVTSLRLARNALIIVDDAKIPTVHRFCTRLAAANDLEHYYAPIDHGLFFFASCEMEGLRVGRDWRETIKAWKRYVLA